MRVMAGRIYSAIRSNRLIIGLWGVLFLLPILIMGWTADKLGPAADDWLMIEQIGRGQIFPWNNTRPLHSTAWWIADTLLGNQLSSYLWVSYVLIGLSGILFFEILRRALKPCIGNYTNFGALVGGLIYVLYPSNVSHQWASTGTDPIIQVALLVGVLLWMKGSQSDQPFYALAAAGVMMINLFQKESTYAVYALLPLIPLYYGRSPVGRRWLWVTAMSYAGMAGFLLWRLVILPRTDPTDMVLIYRVNYQFTFGTFLSFFPLSLKEMFWDAYRLALVDDAAALGVRGISWFVPAALAGAGLLVAGGRFVTRSGTQAEAQPFSVRRWGALAGFGLAAALAGLAPYYAVFRTPVEAVGANSRYTAASIPGLSLLVVMVVLLPILGLPWISSRFGWRNTPADGGPARTAGAARTSGLVITAILAAILIAGGMIRQYKANYDHLDTWTFQRTLWQRVLDLKLSIKPNSAIFLYNFPLSLNGFPIGYGPLEFDPALKLIYHDLPPNVHAISSGPGRGWHVVDGTTLVSRRDPSQKYPLDDVIILYLDNDNMIEVSPRLPSDWTDEPIYLYTGTIPPGKPTPITDTALALFGDRIEPTVCRTHVPVFSHDSAPSDGNILVAAFPTGQIIDRRAVARGVSLDYSVTTPCGIWVRVYFERPDAQQAGALTWLPSQYGSDADYGTDQSADSVVYDTSFADGIPVDAASINLH